jgi:release factor glutamine methyltransferase
MPSLLSDLTHRLTSISDTPALDASVLLAQLLDRPRSWIIAHPDEALTAGQQEQLSASLARIESGEPFPYVLGYWEFFGMEFEITPDVLIPRPETELLVEKAISWLQAFPAPRNVADIGTGSGAIAVSLAVRAPDAAILATDISPEALDVARRNSRKYGVEDRIHFVQCDLFPARTEPNQRLDLICANLPYIPSETLYGLSVFGREPSLALDGGKDGLDPVRRLLSLAPDWLAPNGRLLLEIESTQGGQAESLARGKFPKADIHLHQDLAGHDRLLEIAL